MKNYDTKKINDTMLRENERSLAEQKKYELDKTLDKIKQIDSENKMREIAAYSVNRRIPLHIWRPAWSTTQTINLIQIVYTHNQILAKTLDKISDKWDYTKDFIDENIKNNLNSEEYSLGTQAVKDEFAHYYYPQIKDMNDFVTSNENLKFPFKERVIERKKQRGLK